MGTVDLDDRFDDPLLYLLHPIELFVQDLSCLLGIDRFKVVIFPLDVHHDGKCALRMAFLFRGDFMGAGNCKVSPCPEPDVVRHRPACAGHKVRDALQAGQLHIIPGFVRVFICFFFGRSAACQKPFNHELKKTILRRQFGTAAKGSFPNLVDRITVFPVFTGQADMDMVFSKPLKQTYKTGINPENIRREDAVFFFELKGGLFDGIGKHAAGMMLPCSLPVV